MQRMLAFNPADRPTMEEILSHPWVTGETASYEEYYEEMKMRHENTLEKERQSRAQASVGHHHYGDDRNRGLDEEGEE
jgi:hypothetical protein